MNCNKWNFSKVRSFGLGFNLEEKFSIERILEIAKLIIDVGSKYDIFFLEDNKNDTLTGDDFVKIIKELNSVIQNDMIEYDFLNLLLYRKLNIDLTFKIKLAVYSNENCEILFNKFHSRSQLESFLPYEFRKHTHYLSGGEIYDLHLHRYPDSLSFGFNSSCHLFLPYFILNQGVDDVLIDNRELYFLNNPRLEGFLNEIGKYFLKCEAKKFDYIETNLRKADFQEYREQLEKNIEMSKKYQ
jgi:hypothetical protein